MAGLTGGDLAVVVLPGPGASAQAAEGPLVDGGAEVAVVVRTFGHHMVAFTGSS